MKKKDTCVILLFVSLLISCSPLPGLTNSKVLRLPRIPLIEVDPERGWTSNAYEGLEWGDIAVTFEQENPNATYIYNDPSLDSYETVDVVWKMDKGYKLTISAFFDIEKALAQTIPWKDNFGKLKYEEYTLDNLTVFTKLYPMSRIYFSVPIQKTFVSGTNESYSFNATYQIYVNSSEISTSISWYNGTYVTSYPTVTKADWERNDGSDTGYFGINFLGHKIGHHYLYYEELYLDYFAMVMRPLYPQGLIDFTVFKPTKTGTSAKSETKISSTYTSPAFFTISILCSFVIVVRRFKKRN